MGCFPVIVAVIVVIESRFIAVTIDLKADARERAAKLMVKREKQQQDHDQEMKQIEVWQYHL